jgi:hypothetical protein
MVSLPTQVKQSQPKPLFYLRNKGRLSQFVSIIPWRRANQRGRSIADAARAFVASVKIVF